MSGLSYTACNIASSLIAIHDDERWSFLVSAEDAAFYKNCLTHAQKYSSVVRVFRPFPKLVAALLERLFAKGIVMHFALRKKALRQLVEEAYAGGARQCVILGGGLDVGAYRLAGEHKDFTVFEIDRPFMHTLKMQILQDSYGQIPANFMGISADLATARLMDVLSSAQGFDSKKQTVFFAEGVIMYLSQANVVDLLQQIRSLASSGGRFIFTAMPPQHKVRHGVRRWVGDLCLKLYGETTGFEMESDKIGAFLERHQFKVLALMEKSALQAYLPKDKQTDFSHGQSGEYIVSSAVL